MVFKTICVGSIPATLVILSSFQDKSLTKFKLRSSSQYLWSLKKKAFFQKQKAWFFLNTSKRKFLINSQSCFSLIKNFFPRKKNFKAPSIIFQTSHLKFKPEIILHQYQTQTLFSKSLLKFMPFFYNTHKCVLLTNPSYLLLNQFLIYKVASFLPNISTNQRFSQTFSLVNSKKLQQVSTNTRVITNFLKNNYLVSYFFKNVKYQLSKKNFFLETFFLKNYEFRTHKLLRLDAYSTYYFLKDFFLTNRKEYRGLYLNFYSTLLLNDNNFEYSQFPTIIPSSQTFQKLEKQKVKNKRKKFKKGFSKLNTLVTIKTNILNSLKFKLKKQKHYLKVTASNLTYLSQSSSTIKSLQPTLLLNFQFSKLINFSSLLIKYLFINTVKVSYFTTSTIAVLLENYYFSNRLNFFRKTNLVAVKDFSFILQKKILKIINFDKFKPNIILWYYTTIIRFIEFYSGKKVFFKLNPFIENALTFSDLSRCNLWFSRIQSFQRMLGPKVFIKDSLKVLHLAFRFKDVTFLSNWIRAMLQRMDFWSYKLLFRYLKYLIRNLFFSYFPDLKLKGLKFKLKGKISVAGNARTRKLLYSIGNTSHSTYDNRIAYDLSFINTFTGVLGFQIWFFF